jgi:branched-chain amino acid transport system substrate-binding protein
VLFRSKEKKVPLIGQWINSAITKEANGKPVPYLYLGQPTADAMAVLAIEYMINVKGCKKLALIYDQTSAYTVSQTEVFKAYAKAHNISIVNEQTYIADTTDFKTHLTSIRNSGADGIYAPGNITTNTIYLNTLDQLGMSHLVTMGDVNYAPPFLATMPDPSIVKNVYFPLNIDLSAPRLNEVADIYMETWNDVPSKDQINVKYYLSYDMVYMSAAAIKQALDSGKPLNGETVNEALENTSIIGLTGPLAFSKESHQVSGREVSMYIYSINGKYEMEGIYTAKL